MELRSMVREAQDFIKSRQKVTLVLAAVNIAVFIVLSILGDTRSGTFMLRYGAAYTPLIMSGEYWRLAASMFLHFGLEHLIYNMICILSLGNMLESLIGSGRYLVIYLLGGLGGNLLSLALDLRTGSYAVSAGASGAIFAVVGAWVALALKNRRRIGRPAIRRVILVGALMLLQGFTESGIDNAAHVGGALTGFVLAALIRRE